MVSTRSNYLQMTIYVFFPVGLFYYFNRPLFYRNLLEEKKVSAVFLFLPYIVDM